MAETHPQKRLFERAPDISPDIIPEIERRLYGVNIPEGVHHVPLRHPSGVLRGYAVIKLVGRGKRPVVATVLSPEMLPPGQRLGIGKMDTLQRAELAGMAKAAEDLGCKTAQDAFDLFRRLGMEKKAGGISDALGTGLWGIGGGLAGGAAGAAGGGLTGIPIGLLVSLLSRGKINPGTAAEVGGRTGAIGGKFLGGAAGFAGGVGHGMEKDFQRDHPVLSTLMGRG